MELEVLNSQKGETLSSKRVSTVGKILLYTTGGIGVALTVICVPFVSPALRRYCLPYVPATSLQVENVLQALKSSRGKICLDIGSGDGRLVLAAAQAGFTAHGVEINPWLVAYSRINCYFKNLHRQTKFFRRDLWKFNLGPYDNVLIFGVEQMMEEFERKLLSEARIGTTVVACRFPLPNLVPCETIGHGVDTVWRYEIKESQRN